MPKFRSMATIAPVIATHLLDNPDSYLSPIGRFLRRSSLDELPQLFSVLKGDMSFVGPRPALYNQDDLITLRTEKGVDKLLPGITGWAQVNGRDDILIPDKVDLDVEYFHRQSFWVARSKVATNVYSWSTLRATSSKLQMIRLFCKLAKRNTASRSWCAPTTPICRSRMR